MRSDAMHPNIEVALTFLLPLSPLSRSHQNGKNQIKILVNLNSGIAPSELTPALVEAFEREARASAATKRGAQNAVGGGGLSWDE